MLHWHCELISIRVLEVWRQLVDLLASRVNKTLALLTILMAHNLQHCATAVLLGG